MSANDMTQDQRDAIASALKLAADQLAVDPAWSVAQIEAINHVALTGRYRAARDAADGSERIHLARHVAISPLADRQDFAALAHALADDERLPEAAIWMEAAAKAEPRPEYFQFLASVYERAGELSRAMDAVARGLAVTPSSNQLRSDQERIVAVLRRDRGRLHDAAIALWRHEGRQLLNVPGLVARIVWALLRSRRKVVR